MNMSIEHLYNYLHMHSTFGMGVIWNPIFYFFRSVNAERERVRCVRVIGKLEVFWF